MNPRDSSIISNLFSLIFTLPGASLAMVEFGFIICMVIVTNCLELTLDLTDELQKVCYDSSTIREKVGQTICHSIT